MKKSLLMPSMLLMSAALNNDFRHIKNATNIKSASKNPNKGNSKKCKSCSKFPCKPYQKPLKLACDMYVKKHNK